MDKTYISQSELSIRLASGRRIMFDTVSTGGSVYRTGNIDIQAELEQHPLFGTDFCWDGSTKRAVERMQQIEETPTHTEASCELQPSAQEPENNTVNQEQTEVIEEIKEVQVSGIADAKDYLAENFGVMRTQMRSKAQIEKIACENNVKFVGL